MMVFFPAHGPTSGSGSRKATSGGACSGGGNGGGSC